MNALSGVVSLALARNPDQKVNQEAAAEYAALLADNERLKQTNENWARAVETLEAENAMARKLLAGFVNADKIESGMDYLSAIDMQIQKTRAFLARKEKA